MFVAEEKRGTVRKIFWAEKPVLPRIIADHLGSIRVTLDQSGNVDSWTDYYPFGKEARGSSTANRPKEQFTGKERDAESGLDYFGARYYNAEIGRWTSVDPMSGKYTDFSPYHYSLDNPASYKDADGRYTVHPDGREVYRVTANTARMMSVLGALPLNVLWPAFVTSVKAGWNDPSYPVGATDYIGIGLSGYRTGWSVSNYFGEFMSATAASWLGSVAIPAGGGLGAEGWAYAEDVTALDEAIFAAAEVAGYGEELKEGTFVVEKSLAKQGHDAVADKFGKVKTILMGLAEKKGFNLGSHSGVLEFKAWLSKNKGYFKPKDEEEVKGREEER